MLQALRDNMKGAVAAFIVAILVIPFVFFGVDSLFTSSVKPGEVAEVNGEAITEYELSQAILLQRQQILSRYGDQVPAEIYSDENLRQPVLQSLIQREALVKLAKESGMAVAAAVADKMIRSTEAFQLDGQFNPDLFVERLKRLGYTPRTYREGLIKDLLLNQLSSGVRDTAFVTDQEIEQLLALSRQTRDFQYITLPAAPVKEAVNVTEEEVQSYYEANQTQFMEPEQVKIDYLEVSTDMLLNRVSVDEELVKAQYEQEKKEFVAAQQRRVSHILIEPKDDGSDKDVIKQVEQGLASGKDFADLAKQYSDDFVSKEAGGDLGYVVAGTLPEAFESAADKLEVGQVSGVVETEAGYHFIKLTEENNTEFPSFEESEGRITNQLKESKTQALLADILTRLGELTFSADSLTDAAEELNLAKQTSDYFSRMQGQGIATDAKVRDAAFSADVLTEGHNSPVLELSPDHVVVLRVADYRPETVKPLEQVKAGIEEHLLAEKASEMLSQQAAKVVAEVLSAGEVESVAKQHDLEWQASLATERNNIGMAPDLLAKVFQMPQPSDKAVVSSVTLSNGDYAVVRLSKVNPGDVASVTKEQRTALRSQLAGDEGVMTLSAFTDAVQAAADVVVSKK